MIYKGHKVLNGTLEQIQGQKPSAHNLFKYAFRS